MLDGDVRHDRGLHAGEPDPPRGRVALKEDRRLFLVPRETPLSVIHLRALLTLREAGALVAPAMPGFYSHPDTLQDAIDFVAGKVLDLVGVDSGFLKRWGA